MERIDKSVDYQSEGWDNFFAKKSNQWRDKDYRLLISMFKIQQLHGTVLDVGCGLGDGIKLLQKKMRSITKFYGTDFSSEAIRKNQSNALMDEVIFFVHDIHKPLPQQYDNVICLQTIEHVGDPEKAIANLINATREVLIIATPYENRRPDENHLWKFNEHDFKAQFDTYCLDRKKRNIFWIKDYRIKKPNLKRTKLPRIFEKIVYKI